MPPVTVVTGGSRGIGAATALRLAEAGHRVAVGYLRAADKAAAVVRAIRDTGTDAVAVQVNTANENDVERFFDTAIERLGPITGLVNNAGTVSPAGRLVDLHTDDLRRVVDVNVVGYLLCGRRAVREMSANSGGAIVNVSSAAATLGGPGEYVHYAASKAAVDAFTIGLAKELARDGIRVNAVAPGIVRTDIHNLSGDPDRPTRRAGSIPAGRPGEPAEIAHAIAWLLSPEASYTTGAILRVAGGL